MNNNYKCKICRDTSKKLRYNGIKFFSVFHVTHYYDEIECDCIQITNLTTEKDLNNNLMRIEIKINV